MWRYVYEAVEELGRADQLALFKAMKQDLYPKEEIKWKNYFLRSRSLAFRLV